MDNWVRGSGGGVAKQPHGALERTSGVQLQVNDDKDAIRLDGLV